MSETPSAPTLGQATTQVRLPALESSRIREGLERAVEECAHELMDMVPRMRLRRSVYGGEWVVGVHVGGLEDADLSFSRLEFRIHIDVAANELRLTRCMTVRNRDADPDVFEATAEAVGRERLRGFIESAFLGFARRYFESR